MQIPGPTLIVTQGQSSHGDANQQSACSRRKHFDPVSRLPGNSNRRSCWTVDTGSGSRRHGDLYLHRHDAWNARLLQRYARLICRWRWGCMAPSSCCPRPFLGDARGTGTLRGDRIWLRRLPWRRAISGSRLPPTTIPMPATTANICSSSPKWIRGFTARHGRRSRQRPAAWPERRVQLSVATEPYVPAYFMINGRSMPDDMDPNYAHAVSAPALQRQSAHASGRAGAAAHHRPGTVAASVPRARQPRARPGARRQPDSQPPDPTSEPRRTAAVHDHHHAGSGDGRNLLLDRQRA